jgi:hypothetical protein
VPFERPDGVDDLLAGVAIDGWLDSEDQA